MADPEWGADVLGAVFGSPTPADVNPRVLDWLRSLVGQCDELTWLHSGMVAVATAHSANHGDVIVRIYQPGTEIAVVARTCELQRFMSARGVPAARPLVDPTPIGDGVAVVETRLTAAELAEDGWGENIAVPMGAGLARVADVGAGPFEADLPVGTMRSDCFEFASHTSLFDFDATASGAEWIEEHARRAHDTLTQLPPRPSVVSHRDWRLGNVEVANGAILAIYDWGSLERWPEDESVGTAAVGFGAWMGRPGRKGGTPEEAARFVAAYEQSRSTSLDADARRAARAAALMHLAYIARCEHSLGWPPEGDTAQAALRHAAPTLHSTGIPA